MGKKTEALTTYKEAAKLDGTNADIKAAVARLSPAKTSKETSTTTN